MASSLNADNGVVSGSSGLKSTADTSGVLALQSNGSTGVTLDTSLNVGIGVTPSAWRSSFNVTYGERALELTYSALVTQAGPSTILANNVYFNSSNQWIYKNAVASTNAGLYTIGSDGLHTWSVAPTGASGAVATMTQVLSINKDKSLALQGATAATGAGITFPATQSASTDANTLDDYEEGTFTCTGASFTNVTAFAVSNATYTKIGRLVYVEMNGTMQATNSNLVTYGTLSLPFTATSSSVRGGTFVRTNYEAALGSIQPNNTTTCYFQFTVANAIQAGAGASWTSSFFYSV